MKEKTQKERLEDMMKRPIPRKRVGIIHLNMIKEDRWLYGMRKMNSAEKAVEMIKPLLKYSDREMILVVSVNARLEPMAIEIVAVGGIESCHVDVRNLFKHALLNQASSVMCFHNHPSGNETPSRDDRKVTKRISEAGRLLGVSLLDHIIVGDNGYYSFRENGELTDDIPYETA